MRLLFEARVRALHACSSSASNESIVFSQHLSIIHYLDYLDKSYRNVWWSPHWGFKGPYNVVAIFCWSPLRAKRCHQLKKGISKEAFRPLSHMATELKDADLATTSLLPNLQTSRSKRDSRFSRSTGPASGRLHWIIWLSFLAPQLQHPGFTSIQSHEEAKPYHDLTNIFRLCGV